MQAAYEALSEKVERGEVGVAFLEPREVSVYDAMDAGMGRAVSKEQVGAVARVIVADQGRDGVVTEGDVAELM